MVVPTGTPTGTGRLFGCCSIVVVLSVLVLQCSASRFSCLDQHGAEVDWFAALKAPGGYSYYGYDGTGFTDKYNLQTMNGPVGQTLQSVYQCQQGNSSCGYALYNDESPDNKEHDGNAHMKGVVAFDGSQAVWLLHSVPRFPEIISSGYSYPEEETKYGQSFLCMTLDLATLDTIAGVFMVDRPFVFDSWMPSSLASSLPTLATLLNGGTQKGTNTTYEGIKSLGGKGFTMFGKSKEWDSDLYEDLVEPHLNSGMFLETWMDGRGKMPSYCPPQYPYASVNIVAIQMADGTMWKETEDHSKWGISDTGSIACIGDINRQEGQRNRGGGTVCTDDSNLWNAFSTIIAAKESC